MFSLFIAIMIVLLLSGFCSGSEAALFSISPVKVRQLAESESPAAQALYTIKKNMSRPIATIVILNNIANIMGSIAVGSLATQVMDSQWLGLFSGLLTFLVIIFSEIIPKTLGEGYSEQISLVVARPILWLTWVVTPIVWAIEKITAPLTKGVNTLTTNESEIKLLASIGRSEGVIEQDESDMIRRVFELNDVTAAEVMTPRTVMTYLEGRATLASAKSAIIRSQHTRIVLIDETPDKVLGLALKDELLIAIIEGKSAQPLMDFAHKVNFVPETVPADQLLITFQNARRLLAIVVDEYGGVSGVVTLEDVLEVLTGEIVDETDRAVDLQELSRKRRREFLRKSLK